MIFYFSGTGNSRWVAEQIGAALGERLCNMARPQQPLPALEEEEAVGFVLPVHGWKPPRLVRRFIDRLPEGLGTRRYAWGVLTCGDDTGCAAQMLERRLLLHGVKPALMASLVMPNTYIGLPFFDVDADSLRAAKLRRAAQRVRELAVAIKEHHTGRAVHRGALPHLKSYLLGPLFEHLLMSDRAFHSTVACTGCRLCARVCPVGNIKPSAEGSPQWSGRCTMCLACYHHCPEHAIALGHRTQHKGQYFLERYKKELT